MKKIIIALVSLVALILAAAIIIPLVVDVDKYRPQIVGVANEKINGKLELGKLSLSLWGQIRVQIAGLKLADAGGAQVLSVDDTFFHVPFSSIFSGAPLLTLNMKEPTLVVVKDKNGKLNLMSLMKEPAASTATGEAPVPAPSVEPTAPQAAGETKLPGMAARARVGIEVRDAKLDYRDLATGLNSQVNKLNFIARDLSLSRPTELEIWANLDTTMGPTLALRGPFKITGKAEPRVVGTRIQGVSLTSHADFDGLEIEVPGKFIKKKGADAHVDLAVTAGEKDAKIDRLDLKFLNAEIKTKGTVLLPQTSEGGGASTPAVIDFSVDSNEIDFKPWSDAIPMLQAYELAGSAKFEAQAKGPADKLNYKAKILVNSLTAKAPQLKAQPRFDLVVSVVTDQLEQLKFTMKAPGNDLTIDGTVVSFLKPVANFNVTSTSLDFDQLINFPPPPAAAESKAAPEGAQTAASGNATGAAKAPAQDLDASVEPLRSNPMMAALQATMNVSLKRVKAKGIALDDISGKLFFRNLVAGVESFAMKLFDGNIGASFSTNLQPKVPTYQFSTKVSGFDLHKAVASNMALFKNTIVGKADFNITGTGASFNSKPAMTNLNAKGSMRVSNARFATIDVGRMAKEALNGAIEKVAQKFPAAKSKTINAIPAGETRYEFISSDFTIAGGKFSAPNFVGKAAQGKGIDIKGRTEVGLINDKLDTAWELIDTHNITKAADISVDIAGQHVDRIFAEGNNPVKFPVQAGCTLKEPCYSTTQVPEYLAKIALNNTTRAVGGKAKAEVQKKAQELIQKHAPPQVQDKLKSFGQKLFGN